LGRWSEEPTFEIFILGCAAAELRGRGLFRNAGFPMGRQLRPRATDRKDSDA
jgi:hypothetical protein